ncbi:LytR/AlgR family response regulator transcription factor [Bernardetia sp. OM2101]|uniref:LytR/AlgR family response regulator transcription factor n=1 Tax=Bernardetia sp. OM2101 TaxID=3344876 RepID=UPI0035CFA008
MTNYIIIDDEPLAHQLIEKFCGMLPHLQLQKNCYDAFQAMEFLHKNNVELIFLDINMPKLNGFELLRTLANSPKVIVTSAYQEFALEGYELGVVDYLVKPFSFERFVKAVNKAISVQNNSIKNVLFPPTNLESTESKGDSFFVKGDKKHHQINPEKLLYVEAYGNYSKLFLEEEMIICNEKISDLETILSEKYFLRVHKSFIVALEKVKTIEGNQIFLENTVVPIGQTYRQKIQKLLEK